MIYKQFQNLNLSALGLGCMRLPKCGDADSDIDVAATAEMVEYALQNGINYFDTAWMYHGHNSEIVIGSILTKYPRDSYYLATKFPGFSAENCRKVDEIFHKQLEKCQAEYFDFYLCHSVTGSNIDHYLNPEFGVMEYLIEQKKAGKIRHLGFSTHGSLAVIRRFLDAYKDHLEFCQIQLNYLDWTMQNAKGKVELLNEYGIPVWVMEPVRGGRLVKLNEDAVSKLDALRPGVSTPEWAFRFLQSVPGVTMVLSGMSNMEQLQQNIATFCENKPLTQNEWDTMMSIADDIIASGDIPCTKCSYCTEHCPMSLDIPALIQLYNERQKGSMEVPSVPGPQDCIGCRSCENVCPQGIMISEVMADFAAKLG